MLRLYIIIVSIGRYIRTKTIECFEPDEWMLAAGDEAATVAAHYVDRFRIDVDVRQA